MTTTDVTAHHALRPAARVTQARVLVSEWTKLRSVRSTRWSLLAAVALTIGIAVLATSVVRNHWPSMSVGDRAGFNPLELNFAGIQIAQLAIGMLGGSRDQRRVLDRHDPLLDERCAASPARALGQGLRVRADDARPDDPFSPRGLRRRAGDPERWRLAAPRPRRPGRRARRRGGGPLPHGGGALRLGLGAIVRNTAGGIAVFAAVMFVLPPLMNVLPSSWNSAASPYLPLAAGQSLMATSGTDHLAPWTGFGLFCAYAAVTIGVAAVLLRRRDV